LTRVRLPIFQRKKPPERGTLQSEANMGEVIRFIPKAERERLRLIREARAMYESVFPPSESLHGQPPEIPITPTLTGADVRHDEVLS
jgi:hypothetical protein